MSGFAPSHPAFRSRHPWRLAALLLALMAAGPAAAQQTPVLHVDLTNGSTASYVGSEIVSVTTPGTDLVVTLQGGQTRTFPFATVRRLRLGHVDPTGVQEPALAAGVQALRLFQNAPNPVPHATTIHFELAAAGPVDLAVYSVSGERVRTLLRGPLGAGKHDVRWDGTSDRGRRVAPGVYFYRLSGAGRSDSRRMIFLQ